jgi:hypothetical protein
MSMPGSGQVQFGSSMLFSHLLTSQNKHPALVVARAGAINTATVFKSTFRAERIQTLNPNCHSVLRYLCAPQARDMTLL